MVCGLGLAALASVALLAGCNRGPKLLPASGKVTLDGKAVAKAAVMFHPVAGGSPATGETDDEGVYTLQTLNRPGALAGQHKISVTKEVIQGGADDEAAVAIQGVKVRYLVPPKYASPDTSGLTHTVEAGKDDYPLELKSSK
jgi:hypothetical protein